MNALSRIIAAVPLSFIIACKSGDDGRNVPQPTATIMAMDHHSFARPEQAVMRHLSLDLRIDMAAQRIEGTATASIEARGDTITFDTDGLEVERVMLDGGTPAAFKLGEPGMLGRPLHVSITPAVKTVSITYRTSTDANALLWVEPALTTDKKHPLLFTQGQAILTRSWIPVQDSPGIRFTYDATVRVPGELMAVMSATNPQQRSADGVYRFKMENPIPAYLIALAVGDLHFRSVGPRTGVYAEQSMVDTAAWEFGDMEKMLTAAEDLYGPYRWGRYDVLVLPASFPFGGMENPCLTFATPTILAGDRSLNALIAHELAHSWSGNLVTNATWDDFWLNEGFTVYFEKRICEKIYGADYAEMLAVLGNQDLRHTVDTMLEGTHPEDSRLKLALAGRDPDDGMTEVAYEKGYAFLRVIESKVGRAKLDPFLRAYFDEHAFQSMTTERFITYLNERLLVPSNATVDIDAWVYSNGYPTDMPVFSSERFARVDAEVKRWAAGTKARDLDTKGWSAFEWMHFLRHLPAGIEHDRMAELDAAFGFTASTNSEVVAAWLEQCVRNDYGPAYEKLDRFLTSVGRRKFLMPLYGALIESEKGKTIAANIYRAARPGYHAVAIRSLDELLHWKDGAVMF